MAKYKKNTKTYIESVKDFLKEKYGDIKPEWEAMITLLADNLEMYKQCIDKINEDGLMLTRTVKHPLLSTAKDLQATIFKQVQHLGLSPYAVAKIHVDDEEDADDFVERLVMG